MKLTDRMSNAWRITQIAVTIFLFIAICQFLALNFHDRLFLENASVFLGVLGINVWFCFLNLKGNHPFFVSFTSLLLCCLNWLLILSLYDSLDGLVDLSSFPYQLAPNASNYISRNAAFSIMQIAPYVSLLVLINKTSLFILSIDTLVKLMAMMAAWKDHDETKIALARLKRAQEAEKKAAQELQESKIAAEKERLAQEKARQEKIRQDRVAEILSKQTAQLTEKRLEKNVAVNLDDDIDKFLKDNS